MPGRTPAQPCARRRVRGWLSSRRGVR